MDRYKVEYRSKDKKNKFIAICDELELEYFKGICKECNKDNEGVCCYRKYPLTKAKRIYF